MTKFIKIQKFNLVEVALAIGILAVGVTAILTLFPVGFERGKTAIGENYCAEAADSLFAYIARRANENNFSWNNLFVNSHPLIPISKKTISDSQADTTGDWTLVSGMSDIYIIPEYPFGADGVYGIKVTTGLSAGDCSADFSGMAILWQTPIPDLQISDSEIQLQNDTAVGVNLEISWPVEKPYLQREKGLYYFELYNSNK